MPNYGGRRTKSFDVTESVQDHKDVTVSTEGDVGDLIQEVETYGDSYSLGEKAELLKFYEEPVTIFLYEGNGPNDQKFAHVQINGEAPYPHMPTLARGREHTIKRKFVQRLAEMRTVGYTQPYKSQGSPELENVYRPQVSLAFPFSIVHDANPKGVQWYKKLMGQ